MYFFHKINQIYIKNRFFKDKPEFISWIGKISIRNDKKKDVRYSDIFFSL